MSSKLSEYSSPAASAPATFVGSIVTGCTYSSKLAARRVATFVCALLLVAATTTVAFAEGAPVPDAAIPVVITPSAISPNVFVLNQDRSILGFSMVNPSSYKYNCPPAAGLITSIYTPPTLAVDDQGRELYESGQSKTGLYPEVVGVGVPYSGTTCAATPAAGIAGGANGIAVSAVDDYHGRLFTVALDYGNGPDKLTEFGTSGVGGASGPGALNQIAQADLDLNGQYTSIVPDVQGTWGEVAITELDTDISPGNLWIFDPALGRAVMIVGPGGYNLPAMNAFIIHNPIDVGGGLLVLVNQDYITGGNYNNPPLDKYPLTIIDLGQLHVLLKASQGATSVTLPFVTNVRAAQPFTAMLAGAFDPVTQLVYTVVSNKISSATPTRNVISYDPYHPSAPNETVVADVAPVPLDRANPPQIALNGAAGTLLVLTQNPNAVYTVGINGTGNTASPVLADTFGDTTYQPTAIAANTMLGESYVASSGGNVDVILRPDGTPPQGSIELTAPNTHAQAGSSFYLDIISHFAYPDYSDLSNTSITITATPADGSAPFLFGGIGTGSTIDALNGVPGVFQTAGTYTLVANFPGDATYPPANSPPVVVSVGQAPIATQITVQPTVNSATSVGTAVVTLAGTSYAPSGTITILDGASAATLATYTLPAGGLANPLTVPLTVPSGTTSVTAVYSGDNQNRTSSSVVTSITFVTPVAPTLKLTLPAAGVIGVAASANVAFTSTSTISPTGTILLTATPTSGASTTLPPVTAAQAFTAGGVTFNFTPPAIGTYTITATYKGDVAYTAGTATASIVVHGAASTLTLSAPATATAGVLFNTNVTMTAAGTTTPTGTVSLTARSGASTTTVGSAPASQAFAAGGVTIPVNLGAAGSYLLAANYAGDGDYDPSGSNATTVVVSAASTVPIAKLYPASVAFTTPVGTASTPFAVTLSNTGGGRLNISNIQATGSGFYETANCPAALAPAASCTITITFKPTSAGTSTGSILVTDNATGSPQSVALTGIAQGSALSVSASAGGFIDQTLGTSSFVRPLVTLQNTGTTAVTLTGVNLDDTSDFETINRNCSPGQVLAIGASCTFNVVFHPDTIGAKTLNIVVSTDSTPTETLSLTGNGIAPNTCADADLDKLCDDWEEHGVWVRSPGQPDRFIDLPAMGAKPDHQDIFIQADYMATDPSALGAHSHQPKQRAIARDIDAFAKGPGKNPDGTTGIHLHVDCGPDCVMDPVTGAKWGSLSQAQKLQDQRKLDLTHTNFDNFFDWTIFDSLSTEFQSSGRAIVFHHVIFGHDQKAGDTSSGISRNPSDFRKGASDFVVTLGSWNSQVGTSLVQAGTLMHELGHNLSLQHGGRDEDNYKPNYLSIMNYNFQTVGLTVDGQNGALDYSRFALPKLDETNLDEQTGLTADATRNPPIGGGADINHYGTAWFCPGENPKYTDPHRIDAGNGPINWNCDPAGVISPAVASNVNGEDGETTLISIQDWPLLVFSGGAVGGNGAANAPVNQSTSNEITMEQNSQMAASYGVAIRGLNVLQTAPGTTTTLRFVVANTGVKDDTYTLSVASQLGWVSAAGVPPTIAVAAGGTAEVSVSFTVPAGTASGLNDKLTLNAVSVGAPLVEDSAEVLSYATASPAPLAVSAVVAVFGNEVTGATSAAYPVVLTNTGTAAISFSSMAASGEFSQTNSCGASLAEGAGCVVSVYFTPAAVGARTGTLTLASNGLANPITIDLSGTGVAAADGVRPEVTLSATPAATSTGQVVTLSVTVAAATTGAVVPTGTVTFNDGAVVLGQATLDAGGTASFALSTLRVGSHFVSAIYSGDAAYIGAASPLQQVAVVAAMATAVTVTASPNPAAPGVSIALTASIAGGSGTTQPTGSVSFYDGAALLGAGTLNASGSASFATSTLGIGSHSITAAYPGDATFAAATSAAVQVRVALVQTTTTLTASASTAVLGSPVTFTATTASASGTPSGGVNFFDGATLLGASTLNASGVATYTTSSLTVATHSITARFAGGTMFVGSTSAAVQVIVSAVPPDFSVTASPATLTITRGQAGTAVFTVTPLNSYGGAVTLSCGSLPADTSCAFAPATLTFVSSAQTAQTATLTIDTKLHTAAMASPPAKGGGFALATAFWVPGMFLGVLGLSKGRGRRGWTSLLLLFVCGAGAIAVLSGCGSSNNFTDSGSYTVPITITDGTISHSVSYSIIVK